MDGRPATRGRTVKSGQPPWLALALLERCVPDNEPLVGDLLETFVNRSDAWFWPATGTCRKRRRQRAHSGWPLAVHRAPGTARAQARRRSRARRCDPHRQRGTTHAELDRVRCNILQFLANALAQEEVWDIDHFSAWRWLCFWHRRFLLTQSGNRLPQVDKAAPRPAAAKVDHRLRNLLTARGASRCRPRAHAATAST